MLVTVINKVVRFLQRNIYKTSMVALGIGAVAAVIMMTLTAADAILRTFYDRPIRGAHELNEFLQVILVFFALSYLAIKKRHITAGLIVDRLSQRFQTAASAITDFLSLAILSLITWQTAIYGVDELHRGSLSIELGLPFAPFLFVTAFGCGLACVGILVNMFSSQAKFDKK
ncbi:TRAP transporter small permease [Chloroflexota bacterium]